jgi:release factor glutamine methyltransferase
VTVLDVIQSGTSFIAKRGVDCPRLQVELLLAHALKLPRLQLYLNFERMLTGSELQLIRALLKRRAAREPLQHIVGSTSFCGLEIAVNPNVLIPRPETELLAERGWNFLNCQPRDAPVTALDLGTGSGCVAIALAVQSPSAQIDAIDISGPALAVARENANCHRVLDRIHFGQGNGFSVLAPGRKFDLIVSNPPYVPSGEIEKLQPEVRDYDPRLALDGGPEGLDFYQLMAAEAGAFLKPGGRMMVEIGDNQSVRVGRLFRQHNWVVEAVERDYTGQERILVAAVFTG